MNELTTLVKKIEVMANRNKAIEGHIRACFDALMSEDRTMEAQLARCEDHMSVGARSDAYERSLR
jgi:hypothetical protein